MCSSPFLDRCLNRLGSAHRSPRRPPPTIANQPNAASSTAHCSPTSPSTTKRTPHISAEATVSVLAHTSIDAPAHVTAETKLPHHQAGQASMFLFYVEHRGFEPLTSSMPWKRATNCANAPKTTPQEGHPLRSPDRPGDQANVTGSHPSSPNRTKAGQYLRMGIDTHSCATHPHCPKQPSITASVPLRDSYRRRQLCTSVAFR